MIDTKKSTQKKTTAINRRRFMATATAAVAGFTIMKPSTAKGFDANSRIEVGFVGLGGRGSLIAGMIAGNHKGYQIVSVADYFDDRVQPAGDRFKVAKDRRFSGLSGYQKVIDSKPDAMFFETPPCFFPEHVAASVKAGCHTYFAKPVACDVPGTISILESGKKATKNGQVFLIDYQIPTNEFNIETVKRCHDGQIGKLGMISTIYCDTAYADPPKTANIESRLHSLIWVNDIDLGGGYLVNAGIHAVDAGLWIADQRPVSAMGSSRIVNDKKNGDSRDVHSITYQYENGAIHNHRGEHMGNTHGFTCRCMAWGSEGYAETGYMGQAWVRGNKGGYRGGTVHNLYNAGIQYNLAKFEKDIRDKNYKNDTLQRGVDSNLAVILGREAGMRNGLLTMDEMIKENKKIPFSTKGLKA
jgi:predicted dehydrogenase